MSFNKSDWSPMLVLTRKKEQKIKIGKDIVITVLKIQGNQVSVGIEAPKETQIIRDELVDANSDINVFSEPSFT